MGRVAGGITNGGEGDEQICNATDAVPEEIAESEGKRNNISRSERLTWPSSANEAEAPSCGRLSLSSEASHGDSSVCPENLDITQFDVVNTGTYADPRSPNWETQRKKSRGRREYKYNLGQYCPQRCQLPFFSS